MLSYLDLEYERELNIYNDIGYVMRACNVAQDTLNWYLDAFKPTNLPSQILNHLPVFQRDISSQNDD